MIAFILGLVIGGALGVLAMCLMTAVPVGNLPMIQAEKMGADTTVLSSAIAATTAFSVIGITALIALTAAIVPG